MNGDTWTVGRKLLVAFGAAAFTLLIVALFGYQSVERLIANDHWVDHTYEVRRDLDAELTHVDEAQAAQRGYLITGEKADLDVYRQALPAVESTYAQLRGQVVDDPPQEKRLDTLRTFLDARLGLMKKMVDLRRGVGFAAAARAQMMAQGEQSMAGIRRVLADMDAEEAGLLKVRTAEAEGSAQAALTVIVWGGLAGIVFIGVLGWFITAALSRQIGSSVGRIQSSSAELQASANQQATGAREQATSMSEISTTISELLVTSRQIAESAQRVARIAAEAVQASDQGGRTVERCQESITAIRRQVDLIVTHMLELGRKSQQIGGILEIINELSEQTNILSINASVEAAGAGEAGRRFAVVADEIRKLADRVGASTKEIRALVEEVRSAVNTTVMATESGSKAVEAGTRQFSEVAVSFRGISGLVSTSTEAAREIELSTKQQATAVDQVTVAVTNVAQATRETEAGANQTLQTAGELTSLARDLARVIRNQSPQPARI
jgi:CHASE3 domain sensor protein